MAVPEVFVIEKQNKDGLRNLCKKCDTQNRMDKYYNKGNIKLAASTRWQEPENFCRRCGIRYGGKIKDAQQHSTMHSYCQECGDIIKKELL